MRDSCDDAINSKESIFIVLCVQQSCITLNQNGRFLH